MRIEQVAPGGLPVLYIACRRHKLERDFNSAWKVAFPAPTKAPSDRLCEKLYALWEAGGFPKELDGSCRYVFRLHAAVFRQQQKRLDQLVTKMAATSETKGAMPRDDYRYFLNVAHVR